jgi:hypothetical protein
MFTIIGADGKEYGPVSTDKLREWIASGRANAQTQCRREGETAWSTLGSLPEFSDAFARGYSAPPPVAAADGKVDPKAYADAILARNAKLDLGAALSRSWELLKANLWPLVGCTLLITLIISALNFVPFAGLLLSGIFFGGLQYYFLRRMRGERAEVSDCFAGFRMMTGALIITSVLVSIFVTVGLFLLILPGIYLAVAYVFAYLLVLDHKLEFWAAMEVSRRVITANWFMMFLLVIVAAVLSALGVVALLIGVIFTLPIFYGAVVAAYEQLIGRRV